MLPEGSLSRFASIRSSLSSIYRNYDFHFDLIKMTGLVVLLSLISATLVMTNSVYQMEKVYNKSSDCNELLTKLTYDSNDQGNNTLCDYLKDFKLPEEYYVTVCRYQQVTNIDFRKFINGKPTIQGLYLNLRQWNYLKRLYKYIDMAIENATKKSN